MPSTSGAAKKSQQPQESTNHSPNGSTGSNNSGGNKTRKRKRCEVVKFTESDLESEFEDCNLEDAMEIERKLRKVAKRNSLNDDEMRKLLQKFVKNEHVLALVTLKAEDELAREKREAEQRAVLITETTSVPKLTRAKARELNKTPGIMLPSLTGSSQPEIAALIKDDLHSDDDDEEYTFKEEDFISDDDPNTTASDMESNPRTPQTPLTQSEESPVKLSADGCFKVPLDIPNNMQEDLRIAARTRSKLCLQQTTIEDIQSEFVPPDVEHWDMQDMTVNDEDWMEFLNDFSKPLNSSLVNDDDDPINDPEYVAAEKVPVDAEELRDVNISKKELTELVAELFEGLINEGISLDSIELETPHKFVQSTSEQQQQAQQDQLNTPPHTHSLARQNGSAVKTLTPQVTRQINFEERQQICVSDDTISSTNVTQTEYNFQPDVVSTPASSHFVDSSAVIPIASASFTLSPLKTVSIPESALNTEPELIAVPMTGQPNCFQLAKVIARGDTLTENTTAHSPPARSHVNTSIPYDGNYSVEYISIKKHVYSEYMEKFENLRHVRMRESAAELPQEAAGLTQQQHDVLQQQLRIHVQMLTQTFVQTYSHPDFWQLAPKAKKCLCDLQQKAKEKATYNAWNLNGAVELIEQWEADLNKDTVENKEMMDFINKEIEATSYNARQIPRFPPRIMDLMLDSRVFMYPQYLPRIPFTPKVCSYHVFSPAESQLIALGLEKHLRRLRESGERLSKKKTPLMVAIDRLSRDTVCGKTKRRIWDHIKTLKKTKHYNPVKYFFEHERAPPIEHNLLTFEQNTVLPPRERYQELPIAWQKHIENQKNPPAPKRAATTTTQITASEQARRSYLQLVRETLGDSVLLPDVTEVTTTTTTNDTGGPRRKRRKQNQPTSVTVNVNYVFGAGAINNNHNASANLSELTFNTNGSVLSTNTSPKLPKLVPISSPFNWTQTAPVGADSSVVAYNYDYNTHSLVPIIQLEDNAAELTQTSHKSPTPTSATAQSPTLASNASSYESFTETEDTNKPSTHLVHTKSQQKKFQKRFNVSGYFRLTQRQHNLALKHRDRSHQKRRCLSLLTLYRQQLQRYDQRYQHKPVVQLYYRHFKALDLYTQLLKDLKMFCRGATSTNTSVVNNNNNVANGTSPTNMAKRARPATTLDEEACTAAGRSRKVNRQEENFRNMLLPDSAEDANRKDAIYAFNFYDKVEEILKSSQRPEDCKRFNHILKSFDPKRDRVSELYHKLENLFLPDHPELAQVFLTFLLPSEAAEVGKFFEHFMITNMTTFINKLNVYFNKQPAQIRKIYACLSELAEEEDVNVKKVKAKILPLLKGNQFLIDWFLQQFPEETPPERILPPPERINLKEVQNNQSGEFLETVADLPESPNAEQQQKCQLRYINGRIFYGTKLTLPAKLSFMAANYQNASNDAVKPEATPNACVHGIREHGEKCLGVATAAAVSAAQTECNTDDEEEDVSKALIIDTTAGEEDSCSSIETCDDASLRAHAARLNPSCYASSCFATATSTPLPGSSHQSHHPNAKRSSLNFNEEGKISPRKNNMQAPSTSFLSPTTPSPFCASPIVGATSSITTIANTSNNAQLRDKRKSPTKKSKSPIGANKPRVNPHPMVVIYEQSPAIACAKKLKTLIEEENECETDSKERLTIVARVKQSLSQPQSQAETEACQPNLVAKVENSEEMEFLPEHANAATLSQTAFPAIKMDIDSADEATLTDQQPSDTAQPQQQLVTSTEAYSDEDCKLDIVASLASTVSDSLVKANANAASTSTEPAPAAPVASCPVPAKNIAWTRDEDKIILIEMKFGSRNRDHLFQRIHSKLSNRTLGEIIARHQFLMDFLSKLQGK